MSRRTALVAARRAAKITAIRLAELLGTNEWKIYGFERGRYRPTRSEAETIAAVLKRPVEEVFPNETFRNESQTKAAGKPPAQGNAGTRGVRETNQRKVQHEQIE